MHLFFAPDIDSKKYFFSEEESKHCIRVLRLKIGDDIKIINGTGSSYTCKIVNDSPKKVEVEVIGSETHRPKKKYKFHLAFAPTKNLERIEWMAEKSTEIGIDEFSPIICSRSERKEIKTDRIKKILISAIKQSMNPFLPKVNEAIGFKDFLGKLTKTENVFMAHCEVGDKKFLNEFEKQYLSDCIVMIGPEGDFDKEEIRIAGEKGINFITLGESRLRSETACIAALMEISLLNR